MYLLMSRCRTRANHSLSSALIQKRWTIAYQSTDLAEVVRQRNMCLDLLHNDKTEEEKRDLYKIVQVVPDEELPK